MVRLVAILFCALLGAVPAAGQLRLVDGDTLELDGVRYRLDGIDAPEVGQICHDGSRRYDCADAAMDKLGQLVRGSRVRCTPLTEDGYGRIVARCTADGVDISAQMVATGHAWAFVRYSDRYLAQETEAKAKGLGIWRGPAEPAWDYRARRWDAAVGAAPLGCPIKGNISRNGRIYHPPWSPWYERTRIDEAAGERWFCSEAEAVAAGWRAPRWR